MDWSLKGDDWSCVAWPCGLMPIDWRRNLLHSCVFFNSICSGASFGYSAFQAVQQYSPSVVALSI